ncbi:thiopeptide-type bacteriocin biosynthesis protein [Nonomuraea sp. NPDC000554]|uniref:thiopeptide-type bacteriocin biosynthesis protein n=1 Tax=Nonomuraea sp. NPDC000554 TaxID=3154259 RepID=UPI0033228C21
MRRERTYHGPGHLPGNSPWLYAKLFSHPARQSDLLTTYLPDLLADWEHGGRDDWWFIRYDTPTPHLRLRLRLHDGDCYGPAAQALGRWATQPRHPSRPDTRGDPPLESSRPLRNHAGHPQPRGARGPATFRELTDGCPGSHWRWRRA